jgi:hypothetical protein
MPMKSIALRRGLLLAAAVVLAGGSAAALAQERLPWLRDAPGYAQSGDVDRESLPPPPGAEPSPRGYDNDRPPAYGGPPPGAGNSGYSRGDDTYHPPARSQSFGSDAPQPYGRDDRYQPPARGGDRYEEPRTYGGRDDAYRPPSRREAYEAPRSYDGRDDGYRQGPPPAPPYQAGPAGSDEPAWRDDGRDHGRDDRRDDRGGPPPYQDRYASSAPSYDDREPPPRDGTFSMREIVGAGHGFFGSVSRGMASVIEYAFKTQGRPNGYILGEDAGGAFVAGLRYGEGRLFTRDAGTHRIFWQGPSLGYDAGAEGSKVMVLVYNLRDPSDIYQRFGGVAGSAYVVGGVGLTFQQRDNIVLAPIRAGIGFRLGANVGYLKYTRRPTWNPF